MADGCFPTASTELCSIRPGRRPYGLEAKAFSSWWKLAFTYDHFYFPPFVKGGLGGFFEMPRRILLYNNKLKYRARFLRKNMTESEQKLWSRLRGKQLLGVQFYRQKPIGNFIVDFFAPKAELLVEVDGSQHSEEHNRR
jgi:hypothetical protein